MISSREICRLYGCNEVDLRKRSSTFKAFTGVCDEQVALQYLRHGDLDLDKAVNVFFSGIPVSALINKSPAQVDPVRNNVAAASISNAAAPERNSDWQQASNNIAAEPNTPINIAALQQLHIETPELKQPESKAQPQRVPSQAAPKRKKPSKIHIDFTKMSDSDSDDSDEIQRLPTTRKRHLSQNRAAKKKRRVAYCGMSS